MTCTPILTLLPMWMLGRPVPRAPSPLFDNLVHAVTSGPNWRAWTPADPPWPARHPLGEECSPGQLHIRLPDGVVQQPMCLARGDFLSQAVVKRGAWRDCAMHVRLWQGLDADPDQEPELRPDHFAGSRGQMRLRKLPSPKPTDPRGVLLEVGANIGACTVELLVRTNAKIIAVEPSPANAFYLTRSLAMLAKARPDIAHRVVVMPVAFGDAPEHTTQLWIERTNLGNSVVGSGMAARGAVPLNVTLLPLDDVFPVGTGGVRLLKVDAQGFECRVLRGAAAALAGRTASTATTAAASGASPPPPPPPHRLQVAVVEMASKWLRAQCCRPLWLMHMLRSLGQPGAIEEEGPLLQPYGLQHGPWNVSCLHAGAQENTCIARRFNTTRRRPAPLQLRELRFPPLRRFHLKQVVSQMKLCRGTNATRAGAA
jgi:FkbM family methyltransferase